MLNNYYASYFYQFISRFVIFYLYVMFYACRRKAILYKFNNIIRNEKNTFQNKNSFIFKDILLDVCLF